jgi:hypothetical protein
MPSPDHLVEGTLSLDRLLPMRLSRGPSKADSNYFPDRKQLFEVDAIPML